MEDNNHSTPVQDDQVLEAIFNPEHPVAGDTEYSQCSLAGHSHYYAGLQLDSEEANDEHTSSTPPTPAVKEMEIAAVRKAEEGDLEAALAQLNQAVQLAPSYASLYNNRAQVSILSRCG